MVAVLAIAFAWQANAMEVYVHYTNGTWPSGTTSLNGSGNLTLEMEASDSFENLKAKIEDKSGLTPDFITLSYGTYDNLPNDGTLNNYGITSGTTLNMSYNPPTHTVRLAAGTEEAANWSIASGGESVPGTQVLENVMSGSELTATYNGTQKVKSVKAVKYVAPAATVTTAPTATGAIIEVGSTAALVNAGAAIGGTMMYAVTTTNTKPTSTDGFSASIPTAEGRSAGTYYVWYYAKADADHSDSEIAGAGSVTLAVMTTVTWNSSNVFNSAHQSDGIGAWQSGSLTYEGITISKSGEYISSFKAYDDQTQTGSLTCYGEPGDDDSFTFTAPENKKFCKIEIIDNMGIAFDEYGDWTEGENSNIVWSGTAASTVTLGTVYTVALRLNSIVFTLIDAQ